MSEYTEKIERFLDKYMIKYSAKYIGDTIPPFWGDNKYHATYRVSFSRPSGKKISFTFYQSIAGTESGEIPSSYDVLAAITKYDPGSYEDFVSSFGYDAYDPETGRINKQTMKVYKAVIKEFEKVEKFFSPNEIEVLSEIAV